MSSKNKVNPNINKFFNNLYRSFLNTINIDNSLKLSDEEHEKINFVYCNEDKTKWFVKTENNDKNIFLFGNIEDNLPKPALLTLTFDKLSFYSPNCSGIINSKHIFIDVQYFIDNYPNFKTELNEIPFGVFVNGKAKSINVIKLGEYDENSERLIKNLNILLNELCNFKQAEKPKKTSNEDINSSNKVNNAPSSDNEETCEICGKKLKKHEKILCKKCSKKRHAANILTKLLTHTQPNIPFTKKDLKEIYLKHEINDFIWSLQDFNLIEQKNNEYCLVEQDVLDDFIDKYSFSEDTLEKEVEKEEQKKLNKTCSICKKTLPISKFYKSKKTNDGFEDYCKKCKRQVTAASYLKYLLNTIQPESKFKIEDLKGNYADSLDLNGIIWKLLEFDLIKHDETNDDYCLENKETCQNFLDKYYVDGSVTIKTKTEKPKELTKEEQMNIVIENIRNGKTDKEAANIAGIALYKITYWFNEGKNNSGNENIKFYNRYIKAKKEAKFNSFKNFYVLESFNNKQDLTIADNLRKQQMENVLKEIGSGSSMKTAAFNSGITYETLQHWYKCGKLKSKKEKKKKNETLQHGYKWRQQKFGEEYVELFEKINILQSPIEAPELEYESPNTEVGSDSGKESSTEENDKAKDILAPLSKEYEDAFKFSKDNKTGFAWVNKIENQWVYSRSIDGQTIRFINHDIYKLHDEVLENNMIWGVMNLAKAKQSLNMSIASKPLKSKSSSNLVTINVPVDKKDKKQLKLLAEKKNTSMKDLLNNEARRILNENETILSFNKTGDTERLIFKLDENLKTQIENYSFRNNKKVHDFWDTALHNITNDQKSEDINSPNGEIDVNEEYSKTDITITYVRVDNKEIITIIQGLLDSNELINSLTQLKIFEDNISRIITNRNNEGIDLFIEINIPLSYINNFEEIMGNLNWKINK